LLPKRRFLDNNYNIVLNALRVLYYVNIIHIFLNDLSSFLKTINFYFQKLQVNHKFLTPKQVILITYSKSRRNRLSVDILHTRGCRKRRFTTGLSKQTFHAPPMAIIAIQWEKIFMACLRGASCCRQGLSLTPQKHLFWFITEEDSNCLLYKKIFNGMHSSKSTLTTLKISPK
jgi:hypothetical protein